MSSLKKAQFLGRWNTRIVFAECEQDYETEAARILSHGEVVALPTETVYGLAADALTSTACARIFEVKERPLYDPLIVHLPTLAWLPKICESSPLAERLVKAFWPGPLTLVLRRRKNVPDIVTANQETVAVRMSAHPVFQKVIEGFGRPLAAPSANRFGRISPTQAVHVESELGGRIPLIIDGGACLHGIESTIVSIQSDRLFLYRQGPVTQEQLEEFAPVELMKKGKDITPGSLKSHYAPHTPCRFWEGDLPPAGLRVGLLAWNSAGENFEMVENLSPRRDFREAAAHLYAALRKLDDAGLDLILVEPLPEVGLGAAIMERLSKATWESRKSN